MYTAVTLQTCMYVMLNAYMYTAVTLQAYVCNVKVTYVMLNVK